MLLVRLEDILLEVRQSRPDLRVHDLVLHERVSRELTDDLSGEPSLRGRVLAGLTELAEQLLHLRVVVLEDDDGVSRHTVLPPRDAAGHAYGRACVLPGVDKPNPASRGMRSRIRPRRAIPRRRSGHPR